MGHLTKDPKMLVTKNETDVVVFSIAINKKWKSKAGEDKSSVCFIDCKAFNKNAININKHFYKGRPILVEGRLELEKWLSTTDNSPQSKLRVVVENFHFVDSAEKWNKNSSTENYPEIGDNANYDSVNS